MSKRDNIYTEFAENGYPENPEKKREFATRLFGAKVVGAMESVLEDKMKIVDGLGGKSENYNFLSKLDQKDKNELKSLLAKLTGDSLYWLLVKMASFPDEIEINLMEYNEDESGLTKICEVQEAMELKFSYFDWVEEFSDYIEE